MSGFLLGIDPERVDDEAKFALGLRSADHRGAEWMYLEADGTIAAKDAVIIHADAGAEALTLTLSGAGRGKAVAVAPQSPSQSIVDGKFFWGCIFAPAVAGIEVNVLASAAAFVPLQPTATAGKLDDTNAAAEEFVDGLVIVTAAGAATEPEDAVINYPKITDYPQGV